MRLFASAVTVVALLAHAVMGCCWHHAHFAEAEPDAAPVSCCHEHGDHNADAAAEHPGEPGGGDHQTPGPCEEVDCSFAGGDARLTVDSPLAGLVLPFVELAPRLVNSVHQAADGAAPHERLCGAAIFVLHQRLVI